MITRKKLKNRFILIPIILFLTQTITPVTANVERFITIQISSSLSIELKIDDYLDLINGKIFSFDTPKYQIRRRIKITTPKSFSFFLDIYTLQGQLMGTKFFGDIKLTSLD
jgi:hypothetical protein